MPEGKTYKAEEDKYDQFSKYLSSLVVSLTSARGRFFIDDIVAGAARETSMLLSLSSCPAPDEAAAAVAAAALSL